MKGAFSERGERLQGGKRYLSEIDTLSGVFWMQKINRDPKTIKKLDKNKNDCIQMAEHRVHEVWDAIRAPLYYEN
jgi:hypothetical protein